MLGDLPSRMHYLVPGPIPALSISFLGEALLRRRRPGLPALPPELADVVAGRDGEVGAEPALSAISFAGVFLSNDGFERKAIGLALYFAGLTLIALLGADLLQECIAWSAWTAPLPEGTTLSCLGMGGCRLLTSGPGCDSAVSTGDAPTCRANSVAMAMKRAWEYISGCLV